jgi:hypothetical protein
MRLAMQERLISVHAGAHVCASSSDGDDSDADVDDDPDGDDVDVDDMLAGLYARRATAVAGADEVGAADAVVASATRSR